MKFTVSHRADMQDMLSIYKQIGMAVAEAEGKYSAQGRVAGQARGVGIYMRISKGVSSTARDLEIKVEAIKEGQRIPEKHRLSIKYFEQYMLRGLQANASQNKQFYITLPAPTDRLPKDKVQKYIWEQCKLPALAEGLLESEEVLKLPITHSTLQHNAVEYVGNGKISIISSLSYDGLSERCVDSEGNGFIEVEQFADMLRWAFYARKHCAVEYVGAGELRINSSLSDDGLSERRVDVEQFAGLFRWAFYARTHSAMEERGEMQSIAPMDWGKERDCLVNLMKVLCHTTGEGVARFMLDESDHIRYFQPNEEKYHFGVSKAFDWYAAEKKFTKTFCQIVANDIKEKAIQCDGSHSAKLSVLQSVDSAHEKTSTENLVALYSLCPPKSTFSAVENLSIMPKHDAMFLPRKLVLDGQVIDEVVHERIERTFKAIFASKNFQLIRLKNVETVEDASLSTLNMREVNTVLEAVKTSKPLDNWLLVDMVSLMGAFSYFSLDITNKQHWFRLRDALQLAVMQMESFTYTDMHMLSACSVVENKNIIHVQLIQHTSDLTNTIACNKFFSYLMEFLLNNISEVTSLVGLSKALPDLEGRGLMIPAGKESNSVVASTLKALIEMSKKNTELLEFQLKAEPNINKGLVMHCVKTCGMGLTLSGVNNLLSLFHELVDKSLGGLCTKQDVLVGAGGQILDDRLIKFKPVAKTEVQQEEQDVAFAMRTPRKVFVNMKVGTASAGEGSLRSSDTLKQRAQEIMKGYKGPTIDSASVLAPSQAVSGKGTQKHNVQK